MTSEANRRPYDYDKGKIHTKSLLAEVSARANVLANVQLRLSALIMSAAFSAIMIVGALMLPDVMYGMLRMEMPVKQWNE